VDYFRGAFSGQLLLQLETDLLLSLAVLQLTASLPDSHPGAQEAREVACQLCSCEPLRNLWRLDGLHKLPRPAACTGPQLALQLLPSPLDAQQSAPELRQQEQQHPSLPEQQEEPAERCMLALAAPLLTELLPLLTRLGLKELQQQEQWQQQQQQPAPFSTEQPPSTSTSIVDSCSQALFTLLMCSVTEVG
jgi:hypothetical protein